MTDKLKGFLIAAAALVALVIGGAAIAIASGDGSSAGNRPAVEQSGAGEAEKDEAETPDDDAGEAEEQVRGERAARAGDAALEAVGSGEVTEVEVADEGDTGFEVEVQRPDGSFVEVALDDGYAVVSVERDDD